MKLLSILIMATSLTAFSAINKASTTSKYDSDLSAYIANCTEIPAEVLIVKSQRLDKSLSKEDLTRESMRTLRVALPDTASMLDDEIIKEKNPLDIYTTVDQSCEEQTSRLVDNAFVAGARGCNFADECGTVYKILRIFKGVLFLTTVESYTHN